ncbi:hypothetical protein CROQUDRAFT_100504 [Cronartium quercuum f. sp. fusiforme G11]|uniref:Uncharacterized protein n=1 Tax=Cronartium quercuum f. sp. fusiforme G11 TaxID=708437 RepID=A0A9P6N641_9BASI|nr:hypothetical protein CROQUDRAFT_100504 [Cronartium quercuum f. sp. fusiforme G11]
MHLAPSVSKEFLTFLKAEVIASDLTASYTPQNNPTAEKGNRATTERARCENQVQNTTRAKSGTGARIQRITSAFLDMDVRLMP